MEPSTERISREEMRQRAISRRVIAKLHPGNRLRLMAGLPLLPEADGRVPDLAELGKEAEAHFDSRRGE